MTPTHPDRKALRMSNGTPTTVEKPATWIVIAAFGDQMVVDPEKNLRDLAVIQDRATRESRRQLRLAVVRDDSDNPDENRAQMWLLDNSKVDQVEAALAEAKELADTLNRALGQVMR
ncbi:hypothetical protein [Cryptosporangium phraense]|uniref:Uncharacterized protein n=1 Tax=Cryptosporangium phraense TaxID=2593070 RepID=A0A545ASN8_9ACTN|nr:hypothetical protein [Cryptosporangium phraense]TQS44344.1 hypothetical protein FL583_15540 [Cryptosporangium phraense]